MTWGEKHALPFFSPAYGLGYGIDKIIFILNRYLQKAVRRFAFLLLVTTCSAVHLILQKWVSISKKSVESSLLRLLGSSLA